MYSFRDIVSILNFYNFLFYSSKTEDYKDTFITVERIMFSISKILS